MLTKDQNPVVILGLDGATYDLVDKWTKDGNLPVFKGLIEKGGFGQLKSVPNLNSAAAWSSLITGLNPGKHGLFFFHEHINNSFKLKYLNATHRQGKDIWNILSERGKKVGVINVPMTYPAKKVNGFMIAGLDTPSPQSKGFTYPDELYNELIKEIGDYTIECDMGRKIKQGHIEAGIESGIKTIKQRTEATRYLLINKPWDFFMVVYRVIDNVQHHFWKYLDPEYPLFNKELARKYGDTILQIYKEIDHSLGVILDLIPKSTNIIVVSDHGSAPNDYGLEFLNQFLEKTGYLSLNHDRKVNLRIRRLIKRFINLADTYTDGNLRHLVKKYFFKTLTNLAAERYYPEIDWQKSKAYSPLARPEIWINLEGREPLGIVPKEEHEKVCDEIIERLNAWYDPKSKRQVIKNVSKRADIYKGAFVDKSADIIIQFNDLFITGVGLPEHYIVNDINKVFNPIKDYKGHVFGKHADNGIIITSGPDFKEAESIKDANILNIMPTVLYLMGEELPANLDGVVMESIIKKDFLKKNPTKVSNQDIDNPTSIENDYTKSDEQIIKERLKSLGYIE